MSYTNTFAIIDRSTILHDRDAFWLAKAMKIQALMVAKAWGIRPPSVIPLDDDRRLMSDLKMFPVFLVDDEAAAASLGWHTVAGGRPYAYVFVKVISNFGGGLLTPGSRMPVSVSGVTGHEVAEGMINPNLNIWINGPAVYDNDGNLIGDQYAREVSDCTQDEIETRMSWFSLRKKVHISNFYYPAYESLSTPPGTKLDQKSRLKKPFSKLDSGYFILRNSKTGKVTSHFGPASKDVEAFGSKASSRTPDQVLNDYDLITKKSEFSRTKRLGANIDEFFVAT